MRVQDTCLRGHCEKDSQKIYVTVLWVLSVPGAGIARPLPPAPVEDVPASAAPSRDMRRDDGLLLRLERERAREGKRERGKEGKREGGKETGAGRGRKE